VATQRAPEYQPTPTQAAGKCGPAHTSTGLDTLEIHNFRNIERATLAFAPGLNLITGANASGKTSLLEAIYCLGRVHSFRTRTADQPIRYGQAGYRLFGRVAPGPGHTVPVGVERKSGGYTVHLDSEPVRRLSDLAMCFPVQVFSGDTATVLSGGPRRRRHTLDWALFHVEHRYRDVWQRYARTLRQRNAALRARAPGNEVTAWDAELLDAAVEIDTIRRSYLQQLTPYLLAEIDGLLPGSRPELHYQPGWPGATTLAEMLVNGLEKDYGCGYTRFGAHRADFRLLLDGHDIAAYCSRGQQKSVLVGLMLAQVRYQQDAGGVTGAFLLDDLTSELDEAHQSRILRALRQLEAQVFVTAIQAESVDLSAWQPARLFHVEHGRVREVVQ
jgi:DNA replication and repair protein RecF